MGGGVWWCVVVRGGAWWCVVVRGGACRVGDLSFLLTGTQHVDVEEDEAQLPGYARVAAGSPAARANRTVLETLTAGVARGKQSE